MDNKISKNELIDFFLKGSENVANNAVKALLFGFTVGAFFVFGKKILILRNHMELFRE